MSWVGVALGNIRSCRRCGRLFISSYYDFCVKCRKENMDVVDWMSAMGY